MDGNIYFLMIGGLGFFFYGMRTMSEGLKKVAGERLKSFLHMATRVPIVGVLIGTLITCLIQSSSATTVMVVGFVNAGMIGLTQAISVIIGANIGTTCTAWLVSSMSVFKVTQYALPAVGFGFLMMAFGPSRKTKFWGEVMLGFGMLFIGLGLMGDAFEPLKGNQQFKDFLVLFSKRPILGVVAGMIFTMVLQSSSATIAIVQVMALNGLISLPAAIPIILGDNIGTTITAQLAALGSNKNARRAAMAHTMFNVIGVSYMLVFVYLGWYERLIHWLMPGEVTTKSVMAYIALAHSGFNVVNAIVFLPFIGWLEKVTLLIIPKTKGQDEFGVQYLEKHLLNTPTLALQQVYKEIAYMLNVAEKSIVQAVQGFMEHNEGMLDKALKYERATDDLQSEITQYVIDLSQHQLLPEESQEIPVLLHNVNDIERMGDHAKNIAELAQARIDDEVRFSEEALADFNTIWKELHDMLDKTKKALKNNSEQFAIQALEHESRINDMQVKMKEAHINRLNCGACPLKANYVFLDFIDNVEKIADHLTNIAQGVIGKMQWQAYRRKNIVD